MDLSLSGGFFRTQRTPLAGYGLDLVELQAKSFPADICHYFTYQNTIQNSEDKAIQITEL